MPTTRAPKRAPQSEPETKRWLTADESAEYTRLSRSYLLTAATDGALAYHKVGIKWLFSTADLDAWLATFRVDAAS